MRLTPYKTPLRGFSSRRARNKFVARAAFPEEKLVLGIIFDISGAYYLSRGFIFKKPADIKSETYGSANQNLHMSFGMSGNLFCSFYTQGIEARLGFIFLLVGFVLQGIGIIWTIMLPIYLITIISGISLITSGTINYQLTKPDRVKAIHDRNERDFDKRLQK